MRSGPKDSMRAARCEAGPVTSIFSTWCPPARRALAMASTVSTVSNSASSSLSVRRRLWVNAIFTIARSRAEYDLSKLDRTPSTKERERDERIRFGLGVRGARSRRSAQKDAAAALQGAGHLLGQL